ncbi:hypothetical protein CcaverHIS002_0607640 [Cutaneotrichosporon cavernicola]|uniref:amidase n=1 Tax=Cutaneotrichosporon cavernicola TaxID=279322 RepID=A0AA48QYD9_9TREE|nr:uncharacterized protein CcaverHIS019_0607070 [Cutaneotrichosporon cavernicola]BEI86477.1 hypothetical protein CcaverHIS002_0607640 [Cutaneotrichosporon cavernicola]BEI94248.1 hypothetical protein CcaverHIS019_0607070 [Cutaneotrichosporon cavernicola]BEJ02028.1 hypothetical protein CcaverHIS631_0607100 [Cutaneotrichosporon cavernicola]BEJ09790.1 hypothetical protein CcaverHIS641_0607050 [Cutaneotrichosporon cavernicola]
MTNWEDISKAKIATREAKIPAAWRISAPAKNLNVMDVPRSCGILTARELEITETPAVDLVDAMVGRKYTSEEVTTAFCKRAAIAHQVTNCLTEIMFDEGIAQARTIDEEYKRTGKPKGLMHGLPISLKDHIGVEGFDATVGFISHCNKPVSEDALLVSALRDAGAVFFCKTNVPTGMLMGDTYNNVWGHTGNPYNTDYGSGGSSGGESTLLAMRGSPLGVGSDIGGSIRMPAAITGIYGLKGAAGRFPSLGCKSGLPGQEAVKGVQGPMSADLSSLELWSKVIVAAKPWETDPMCYPVEWRDDFTLPRQLCFGIMMDDGAVRPTPPVKRALLELKAALEAAGHKVVEWTPYNPVEGQQTLLRCLTGDGGGKMYEQVRGGPFPEPWGKDLAMFEERYNSSKTAPPTVGQLWQIQVDRNAYLRKLLESWAATKEISGTGRPIDGLISPCIAFPAAPKNRFRHFGYTGLWNLADFVGVTVPVTFATKDDVVTETIEPRCDDEGAVYKNYNADQLDGMPVGLQILTPRHTEERALALARVAEAALKTQETPKAAL